MDRQHLSILNPNYYNGCHPLNLNDHIEAPPFCQNLDLNSSLQNFQSQNLTPQIPERRRALDHLLNAFATVEFPGKDQFEAYMHHKYRRNCSASTLRLTASSLSQFLLFFQETGKSVLAQLDRQEIEAFVEFEQDRGLKANTVRTHLCAVYAFLRYLIEKKVLGYELLESKIKLKLPDKLPRAIAPEALNRLIGVIRRPRDRALILLLLRTGMRIGELLNTRVGDIDFREQKILIYLAEKTSVGRVVYYSDDAHKALMDWLRRRDPLKDFLFYGQGRDHLSYEAARMVFMKYLQMAGLEHSSYTLHCLRHTFATDLLNAGMRLECLQVLLGHTNLEVTRRYARLSDQTREEEYFTAMRRIEKGELNADDQCDH
jgi:site-specific recombinase XerD